MIPPHLPNARQRQGARLRLFLRRTRSWSRVRASLTPPTGRTSLKGLSPNPPLPKYRHIGRKSTTNGSKRLPLNPQLDLLPPPFPTLGKRENGMTVVPRGITCQLSTAVRGRVPAGKREAEDIITAATMKKGVAMVTALNQAE